MNFTLFAKPQLCKIVGVAFVDGYPQNLLDLDANAGAEEKLDWPPIEMRRNPYNEYDANAIEIRRSDTDDLLGHLPKELAKRIAPDMDGGVSWEAAITAVDIHPDHWDRPGLSITIRRIA